MTWNEGTELRNRLRLQNVIGVVLPILLLPLLANSFAIAGENLTRFPGSSSELPSPTGQYILRNVDNEIKEPNHTLLLKDLKSGSEVELYQYGRYVEVLWSRHGNSLVVNDHGGSDYTSAIVFVFGDATKRYDVLEQFRAKRGDKERFLRNHHLYIEAVQWLDAKKLKIKISGYGEAHPNGFTQWYAYVIDDGFIPLTSSAKSGRERETK